MKTIPRGLLLPVVCLCFAGAPHAGAEQAVAQGYNLRGYGAFSHREETVGKPPTTVALHRFTFADAGHAAIFASKIFSDFELTSGNRIVPLETRYGSVDAVAIGEDGWIVPLLPKGSRKVCVLLGKDRASLVAAADRELKAAPLRRTSMSHPLFMDKWDRYPLGVWQAIGDYERDDQRKTPETFYEWMGRVGLNPQINLGNNAIDLVSNDNTLTWLRRYFAKYGVKYQRTQWLEHNADLYNRNPFLTQAINPHVMTRWDYYGELRDAPGLTRDVQNASFLATLKRVDSDPNQMAILDPNGEIGPFRNTFWGASGPVHQRNFVRYLRDVRGFSLDDVSLRYLGKKGGFKQWADVPLADWRTFYGWTNGAVDLCGEWRMLCDEKSEGYSARWAAPDYPDSDWMKFYYPGDTASYALASRGYPIWMRHSVRVDPSTFSDRIYLSVVPLCASTVQVFLNGKLVGQLDPRFRTLPVMGQFDVTDIVRAQPNLTVVLRFAAGDAPNGPVFLTSKRMEDFPTSDPLLNARRFDHMDYVDWAAADTVRTTLLAIRAVDPDRPIKVHAFEGAAYGWKVLQDLGGYSHHTGSGPGWQWTDPKQRGLTRNIPDSSETGGPVGNLRDLKGLFGNLVFMGKNAHDYFINLQSITKDPSMRAWFESKLPEIKVMGRVNANSAPMASIRGLVNERYSFEFSHWEDWRYGIDLAVGGEMSPLLDEVRIREGHLPYSAIVDEGTPCWDASMSAALQTYVEEGGVLLLNDMSGIHTFTERGKGAGPALAGITANPAPVQQTSLSLDGTDPLFGSSIAAMKIYTRPETPTVSPLVLPGTVVIGTYPDGKPAVTRRNLGKGAVYFFGGSRYPKEAILALKEKLGSEVHASVKGGADLFRTARSNNGCEDLLMVRGLGGKPATVQWSFDYPPAAIYNPVTGAPVPASIVGNTATFTVTIPDWDFSWFAARRPEVKDAFAHWLQRQSNIWQGVAKKTVAPNPPQFRHFDLNHDWKFVQAASADAAQALMKQDDELAGLQPFDLLLWNTPGQAAKSGPEAVGLYRRDFDLPKGWDKDNKVELNIRGQVHDAHLHGFVGQSTIYLNGAQIWQGARLDSAMIDVTATLKPGRNRLEMIHSGAGIMAGIMLVRSALPDQTIDLAGTWQAVDGPQAVRDVALPGEVQTVFLYRDVVVPREQAGKEVWLRVEGDSTFAIVNGRLRYWDMNGPSTSAVFRGCEINVTPDIRFGETNRIVLATRAMFAHWEKPRLKYDRVELCFYPPGRWNGVSEGIRSALTAAELADVDQLSRVVKLYPMVHAPLAKTAQPPLCTPEEAMRYQPPAAALDLDVSASDGQVRDRSSNNVPITVKGTVTPFVEKGGLIHGIYLHGDNASPGYLEIPSAGIRHYLEGKPFTVCAWVRPIAINQPGGSLMNWASDVFNLELTDNNIAVFIQAEAPRRLMAESVLRQRQWQFLTFAFDGRNGRLYVDGVTVAAQTWPAALPGVGSPVTIGSIGGHREFLNAKLAGFAVYPGALQEDQVAKLYMKERTPFLTKPDDAWPEDENFNLHIAQGGISDVAEIPGKIAAGPGIKVEASDSKEGKPFLALNGKDGFLLVNEHERVHLLHDPFSLIMDIRPSADASGMLFRRHHEICLSLSKDGSLVLDANIGRNQRLVFPKAITAGQWNRFMLTYDGQTASLFRDGALVKRENYPGALCGGKYPLIFGADNTLTPIGGAIHMDLRELRLIPHVLEKMP